MRENRLSGSEGGVAQPNVPSLPLCAPEMVCVEGGGSPPSRSLRYGRGIRNLNCGVVTHSWRAEGKERPVRNNDPPGGGQRELVRSVHRTSLPCPGEV
jgi:hypothetical protein